MNGEDYWERFMTTGKIQDFLNYRNGLEYEANHTMSEPEKSEKSDEEQQYRHREQRYREYFD